MEHSAQGVNPGQQMYKDRASPIGAAQDSSRVSPLWGSCMVRAIHRAYALGYTCITPSGVLLFYIGLLAITV